MKILHNANIAKTILGKQTLHFAQAALRLVRPCRISLLPIPANGFVTPAWFWRGTSAVELPGFPPTASGNDGLYTRTCLKNIPRLAHILPALVLLLLSGCAALEPVPPEVNLMNVVVDEVTLSHVNMLADLRVANPNDTAITVQSVEYELFLNGVKVSRGQNNHRTTIGANDSGKVELKLSSAYWDIFRFLGQLQGGNALNFRIKGAIQVGGFGVLSHTFKFDREGSLPGGPLPEGGTKL